MSTIKVNELGNPMSPNTPRTGNWVTVEKHKDETVIIRGIDYDDASIEVEHMDGKRTHHFFRDIIYISKEYYDSSE
tara:strand:+ start:11174 stop:11401 length:228 start_codon:yes stop_codon:yes gene_type:complete